MKKLILIDVAALYPGEKLAQADLKQRLLGGV